MIFADEPAFPVFGAWEAAGPGAGAMVFAVDAEARVLMQLRDDRPADGEASARCARAGLLER